MDDVLGKLPLFAALDDDANVALRVAMRYENFSRGDVIFDEGDPGTKLFAVIEGKVKLARTAPDGRENLQAVLGPGEMFGELSLFDPKPRTAGAVALTDTVLASLAHEELRPWITGRPDVAVQLLQALAQRLRRTNDVLADLVFSDVPSRVAKALSVSPTVSVSDQRRHPCRARPHPRGTRATCRCIARNREQGTG